MPSRTTPASRWRARELQSSNPLCEIPVNHNLRQSTLMIGHSRRRSQLQKITKRTMASTATTCPADPTAPEIGRQRSPRAASISATVIPGCGLPLCGGVRSRRGIHTPSGRHARRPGGPATFQKCRFTTVVGNCATSRVGDDLPTITELSTTIPESCQRRAPRRIPRDASVTVIVPSLGVSPHFRVTPFLSRYRKLRNFRGWRRAVQSFL